MSEPIKTDSARAALQQALALGSAQLEATPDPMGEARALLALAANTSRAGLMALDLSDFDGAVMSRYAELIEKRKRGMPMSHLRGARDFYKQTFKVTPDVLDPRADTESLVSAALDAPFSSVLDLGTGSGCILLSLLDERPTAQGIGADISQAALSVASQNAAALGLTGRATFIQSDWFGAINGSFDLIVSNPPYISLEAYHQLMTDVRDFEPRIALTDEGDGLSVYRLLCAQSGQHLQTGGRLLVEIGYDQGAAVQALFDESGFTDIQRLQDMEGRDRVVGGVWRSDCATV